MAVHQRHQRGVAVGHLARILEALVGPARPHPIAGHHGIQHQHLQRQVGQGATAGLFRVGPVAFENLVRLKRPNPIRVQALRQLAAQLLTQPVDALWVDDHAAIGQIAFARRGEHQLFEGGVQRRIAQHLAHGLHKCLVQRRQIGLVLCRAGQRGHQPAQAQALTGLPAVEGVAVVLQQHQQRAIVQPVVQMRRCRQAAQQRRHRRRGHVDEGEGLLAFSKHQHPLIAGGLRLAHQPQRQGLAVVGPHQAHQHRHHAGQFAGLAGGGRGALAECERVAQGDRVVGTAGPQGGCAGLAVPALEGVQMRGQRASRIGVRDRLRKIVAGDSLAIMALKVQIHAGPKARPAHQGGHHAHQLSAFFVDGGGVEVVDLGIAVGPHRVGHRAGVLRELHRPQAAHIVNAFHRPGRGRAGHVHRELLVSVDRQALFQ